MHYDVARCIQFLKTQQTLKILFIGLFILKMSDLFEKWQWRTRFFLTFSFKFGFDIRPVGRAHSYCLDLIIS